MSARRGTPHGSRRSNSPVPERPESLPAEPPHYELRPSLVRHLTWAHRNADKVVGMRFFDYGRKRLETQTHRKRIKYMVMRAGHASVTLDEVTRVLAGDLLQPRRRLIE
ncbi:MAG: hypothetical protein CL908_10940 [Deltaproteobacteria bacterium]|nr:hypothetical protein [Deltaproteobacteria bacterium]